MIQFRLARNPLRDVEIVEVYLDGSFVATITPANIEDGIRVITTHMQGEEGEYNVIRFSHLKPSSRKVQ
jgi:hypothetical protein